MFDWVAHNPQATPDVIFLIVAIFSICLAVFLAKWRSAQQEVDALTAFVTSGNVYSIAANALTMAGSGDPTPPIVPGLSPTSPLAQRFSQYCEGLLSPVRGEKTPRATRPAADLLDADAVTREAINLRLFDSIPNVLVGLGLLFTFFGLTSALYFATQGSAAATVSDTQASVHNLLDAASFKFGSSLAALFFSIIFLLIERLLVRTLQNSLLRLTNSLDRLFPLITVEELMRLQIAPGHLKNSADSLVTSARQAIAEALDSENGSTSTQLRAFLSDVRGIRTQGDQHTVLLSTFAESIADSISRSLDSTLGFRITDTFGRLDSTIAKIGQTMQSANEKVLERLLEHFLKVLETRTRDSFTTMVDASNQYIDRVTASGAALNSSLASAAELSQKIAGQGQQGLALLKDATAELSEMLERSRFAYVEMAAASDALSKTQRATTSMLRQVNEAQERANGAIATLGDGAKSLQDAMARSAETMSASDKAFISKASSTYERYRETFEELNKHVSEGLASMTADVTRVTEALKSVASSTEDVNAKMQSRVDAFLDRLERRASQEKEELNEHVRESLASMTADVTRVTEALKSVASSTERSSEKVQSRLHALLDRLEQRAPQYESALNGRAPRSDSAVPTVRGET
jgi:FtsZ-binding cell division protein ZapB